LLCGYVTVAAAGKNNNEARGSRCGMPEDKDEPTIVCPNCGALVPMGAPRCFICEELMPEPAKAEVKPPELAPEELPPAEKIEMEAPKPVQEEAAKPTAEPVSEKPPAESRAPPEIFAIVEPEKVTAAAEKAEELKEPHVEDSKAPGAIEPERLAKVQVKEEALPTIQPEVQIEVPQVKEEIAPQKDEVKPTVIAPVEMAREAPPAKPSDLDKKKARLRRAYKSGRITKELYLDSVKALEVPPPETPEQPRAKEGEPKVTVPPTPTEAPPLKEEPAPPKIEEKIPAEMVAVKEAVVEPPAKPSAVDKKVARLKKAYEGKKITKGIYIDSLNKLGVPLPPGLEEGPIGEAAPEEKLPAEAPPTEELQEEVPAKPSRDEAKASKLKAAYEAGVISRDVYRGNLVMLGLPVPSEIEVQEEAPENAPSAEALSELEVLVAESVPEEVPRLEEEAEAEIPQVEEAPAEAVEEAPAIAEAVSKGEIEEVRRSYRGVVIASLGGLVYVLVWMLFIPMLGNFLSFVLTAMGAVLIVVGYNVASNDAAAAKRARTFKCPLCSERLDVSVSDCPNCGARFSD
jgi:hypothetical protein